METLNPIPYTKVQGGEGFRGLRLECWDLKTHPNPPGTYDIGP